MKLVGHIDIVTPHRIVGWAADEDHPDTPVVVDIYGEDRIVGRTLADLDRPGSETSNTLARRHGFAFEAPPKSAGRRLSARVAGVPLEGGSASPTIVGVLERTVGRCIVGWALDRADPDRALTVELLVDGVPIAHVRPDIFRDDLAAAGLGHAGHGFEIMAPALPRDAVLLTAREASSGVALEGDIPVAAYLRESGVYGYLDAVSGGVAVGWACDPVDPSTPLEVEFLVDGRIVGTTRADLPRADVEAAGLGGGFAGFRQELDIDLMSGETRVVTARLKHLGHPLAGTRTASLARPVRRWLERAQRVQGRLLDRVRRRADAAVGERRLSILMPIGEVRPEWLETALESVLSQWCARWELLCVDGADDPEIGAVLERFAGRDARIIVILSDGRAGEARGLNAGLAAAGGSHIAKLEPQDELEPDAVYRLLEAAAGADLIYSDEALTTEQTAIITEVQARPAFSYDFYLSHPYFVHLVCVPTVKAREIGGWDETLASSIDQDFVLRVLERADRVSHTPRILYRRRTRPKPADAGRIDAADAAVQVLNRHLAARGVTARASPGLGAEQFRIDFPDPGGEVLIVIPTKNRLDLLKPCLESLARTVRPGDARIVVIDHESDDPETIGYMLSIEDDRRILMPYAGTFNYPAMNNEAVRRHADDARFVLFLNNDIEAIDAGWLERMRSLCSRPDVGAVGATLIYASGLVQHAGVIIGTNGAADHAHRLRPLMTADGERTPGYNNALVSTRDYSAVTAACLMMRAEVFREVGGFDEHLAVGFNDTDLCLRVGERGYKILNDAYAVLHHYESATRVKSNHLKHPRDNDIFNRRWSKFMEGRDPYYSPLLTLSGPDHRIADLDRCGAETFAPRTVKVRLNSPTPPPSIRG